MSAVDVTWPDSGELNRQVSIKQWVDTANISLGITQTFVDPIVRWAKIQPTYGAAMWGGEQIENFVTHIVWLRYAPGARPEDLTQEFVVDYLDKNQRFRIQRALDVNDARVMTRVECKLIGPIV